MLPPVNPSHKKTRYVEGSLELGDLKGKQEFVVCSQRAHSGPSHFLNAQERRGLKTSNLHTEEKQGRQTSCRKNPGMTVTEEPECLYKLESKLDLSTYQVFIDTKPWK